MIGEGRPFLRENLRLLTYPVQKADFQSVFARSASAVAFWWAQDEYRT